jgi:hypothetical protein
MSDTQKLVTLARLTILLDAYGATPDCWPEEERTAALALIETSAEARMLMADAAALDSLLDKIPEPEVSAALTSRVRSMALPVPETKSIGLFSHLADYLRPKTSFGFQGAVAMAGVLGMVAGIGVAPMVYESPAANQQVIATSAPLSIPAPTLAVLSVADSDQAETASLALNRNNLSLTGDDISVTLSDNAGGTGDTLFSDETDTDQQSDTPEFSVASVPLY